MQEISGEEHVEDVLLAGQVPVKILELAQQPLLFTLGGPPRLAETPLSEPAAQQAAGGGVHQREKLIRGLADADDVSATVPEIEAVPADSLAVDIAERIRPPGLQVMMRSRNVIDQQDGVPGRPIAVRRGRAPG